MLNLVIFSTCVALVVCNFAVHETPQFPSSYQVKGYVELPYAELKEDFQFWVLSNDTFQSSRLDWYNGLDIVIDQPQSGSFGTTYQVSYTTLTKNGRTVRSCFEVYGSNLYPVKANSVLPDLEGFTYGGTVVKDGLQVDMMFMKEQKGGKENSYKFYYTMDQNKVAVPVSYEFLGYDKLLGSHYDKYEIVYSVYTSEEISVAVFDIGTIVDESTCGDFPGPGASSVEHQIMLNPMHDLLRTSRYEDAHAQFASDFGKQYDNEFEKRRAGINYMKNLRLIHSRNRQGKKYKLAVNFMADMDQDDRKVYLGLRKKNDRRKPTGLKVGPKGFTKQQMDSVPEYLDWRLAGAVTQVKDQAFCGSCWSFGTTGTLEGAYFLKYGHLVRLSQQNLMDCSWEQGNNGCDGGEDWRSYEYIQSQMGGLMTEDDYGQYLGQNGKCHFNSSENIINIDSYAFVTGKQEKTVKTALNIHGPLSVGIDASLDSFSFYSHGIYDDPECKNALDDLDHSVLLVGYGNLGDTSYWLVKNSWSTYWGNLGYVTFATEGNVCGVMTQPSYVTLANSAKKFQGEKEV